MSQSISTVVRTMLLLGGEGTWRLPPPNSGPHGTQRCRGSCLAAAVSSHLRKWRSRAWQSPPVPRALPWEHPPPTKKAHQAEMCSDWEPELSCLFLAAVPTSTTGDHQATPGIHLHGSSVGWTALGASPQIQNSRTQT